MHKDMAEFTLTFNEASKGWTSFFSYMPERIVGFNTSLFTFKNGQLFEHHREDVPRNNFYGEQFESEVEIVFNDFPTDDKIFKAISLEGDARWDLVLKTNLSESAIYKDELERRESRYFGYTRGNENEDDNTSFSTIGIGLIESSTANSITVTNASFENVTTGNEIFQIVNDSPQLIGTVENIQGTTATINITGSTPVDEAYCYAKKNARIEGGNMRGYYLEAKLKNDSETAVELFSVNTKIAKSYV